jgi:hypothetical protein
MENVAHIRYAACFTKWWFYIRIQWCRGGGGAVVCRALLNTTNWLGFQCFHSRPSPQVTRSTTSWSTRSSTTRELPPPLPVYTTDATSGQKSCAGSKRALGVTIRFDINHGGSARSLAPPVPPGTLHEIPLTPTEVIGPRKMQKTAHTRCGRNSPV